MRTILSILCLYLAYGASAKGQYIYADDYVKVSIEWSKNAAGSDLITLKLLPLVNILVLDNDGCFQADKNEPQGTFRNTNCPFYIVNQCSNSIYRSVSKDTELIYRWIVPRNKKIDVFTFDISYIPTTPQVYHLKRRRITKVENQNGKNRLSVEIDDERELLHRAYLSVEY